MPQTSKKSASQKIIESLGNLAKVSAAQAEAEKMIALTDNEVIRNFIRNEMSETRFAEDISYLRGKIIRQAGKVAETMDVEQFAKFATGLSKLIS